MMKINIMKNNYNINLNNIDNANAEKIISILEKNGCTFINDLIINYMEIFLEKPHVIEVKLSVLKNELGNSYMSIIENNLNLLVE